MSGLRLKDYRIKETKSCNPLILKILIQTMNGLR